MSESKINRRKFIRHTSIFSILSAAGLSSDNATLYAQPQPARVGGPHLKLSLNAYSFNKPLLNGDITLDEVLEFCAELGFDAIDPTAYYFPTYPKVPRDHILYEFKRKAFTLGLDISGTGVRNDFTVPDKNKRQADIQLIKTWIEGAAKLGAPVLRIFAGKKIPEGYSRDQVTEWVVEGLSECVDYARQFGIMIVLQNHAGFLKTADDVLTILKQVNSEWLGLMLDIGSFPTEDPYTDIAKVAPYAVTWQIKEHVKVQGKQEKTDLDKLFKIIRDANYRGYLPLETLGAGDPKIKVTTLLKEVREALALK